MTGTVTVCPHCGVEQERHVPVGRTSGTPVGHVSICATCGGIAVVAAGPFGITLRQPTLAEAPLILAELRSLETDVRRRLEAELLRQIEEER